MRWQAVTPPRQGKHLTRRICVAVVGLPCATNPCGATKQKSMEVLRNNVLGYCVSRLCTARRGEWHVLELTANSLTIHNMSAVSHHDCDASLLQYMAASASSQCTWLAVGGHHGREQNKVLQRGPAAAGIIQVLRGPRLGRRGSIPP